MFIAFLVHHSHHLQEYLKSQDQLKPGKKTGRVLTDDEAVTHSDCKFSLAADIDRLVGSIRLLLQPHVAPALSRCAALHAKRSDHSSFGEDGGIDGSTEL